MKNWYSDLDQVVRDVADSAGSLDSESVEEYHVVVHPGCCSGDESYREVDGLTAKDYQEHRLLIDDELDDLNCENSRLAVAYRSSNLAEAKQSLGDRWSFADEYIETAPFNGFVNTERGAENLARVISQIEDGGSMIIHGEIRGLCTDDYMQMVSEIEGQMEKSFGIRFGETFPENPLQWDEGKLTWQASTGRTSSSGETAV